MKTKDFIIEFHSPGTLIFYSFNTRLSNKINKVLRSYMNKNNTPYRFLDGEEGIFYISEEKVDLISQLLPYGYSRGFVKQRMREILSSNGNNLTLKDKTAPVR